MERSPSEPHLGTNREKSANQRQRNDFGSAWAPEPATVAFATLIVMNSGIRMSRGSLHITQTVLASTKPDNCFTHTIGFDLRSASLVGCCFSWLHGEGFNLRNQRPCLMWQLKQQEHCWFPHALARKSRWALSKCRKEEVTHPSLCGSAHVGVSGKQGTGLARAIFLGLLWARQGHPICLGFHDACGTKVVETPAP